MKTLGLWRHAEAEDGYFGQRDFERVLTYRGKQDAVQMGEHIRRFPVSWDKVLASPALRVTQTLSLSGLTQAAELERDAYIADSTSLLSLLARASDAYQSLLLVGHNPGLHALLYELADKNHAGAAAYWRDGRFPTSSFAVLDLDIAAWEAIQPRCGLLRHLMQPDDFPA